MSRLFGLLALLLLMALLLLVPLGRPWAELPLSLNLGFLLLAGFVLGKLGIYARLPGITGYLLAGVAFGPSCLGILGRQAVDSLTLINSFALTLIALTAGGEVNLSKVRERIHSYGWITAGQTVVTFLGVMLAMAVALHFLPGRFPAGPAGLFVVSALLAVIALANSPSSTVAVIVESGARGHMSQLVLGITILKDILVILAFAVMITVGTALLGKGAAGGSEHLVALVAWELAGSILFGVLLGFGIISYIKYVGAELPVFIIAVSFLSYELSSLLHLHALLVCMTAGLAVNNLSGRGREFIRAVEKGSLPVYVVFFAIAGADLDFSVLSGAWRLVLVLVASRFFFTWLGTVCGSLLAREEPVICRNVWMGFITQAGVSLGLAVAVAGTFSQWGEVFRNVVVGSIAVFQLIGPVLFKFSLIRAGEIQPGKS
ncbi:MAG: cation:proton antiporter [Candidatus Glassbacteria bacterium]|nr:cation:proton antiporter [Candidatus Glassbacteria bacterium]